MTLTYADGFAFIPKRCSCCNRLFWFESFYVFYRTVGIENYSLKQIMCKRCKNNNV